MLSRLSIALLSLAALTIAACSDDDTTEPANNADTAVGDTGITDAGGGTTDGGGSMETMSLKFAAVVGDAPFSCASTYEGFGPAGDWSLQFLDARMFVHGVELQAADGTWTPVAIRDLSPWQGQGVALVDFEDRTGTCANGTTDTHTIVPVDAAVEGWQGVRFVLGVPFELNHADASSAAPPLDVTALFWNWQGGYKFARMDVSVTGPGGPVGTFNMHLGSTGCDGTPVGGVTACANANRPSFELTGFNPATGTITVQLDSLYAGMAEPFNTEGTPPGCMSGGTDPECAPVFEALGLAGDGQSLMVAPSN